MCTEANDTGEFNPVFPLSREEIALTEREQELKLHRVHWNHFMVAIKRYSFEAGTFEKQVLTEIAGLINIDLLQLEDNTSV